MAARIRSLVNSISPVDEASREDLIVSDVVTVQTLDAATTYAWALVFVPDGSTATFSGSSTDVSPGSFTVDLVGSYLVRLIVDANLSTEDTQYVSLCALSTPFGLHLVAAGERRDESGIIPVDADPEGWANRQNNNLLALEAAIVSVSPTVPLVSGEALTANDVVAFDANAGGGRVIKADADDVARSLVIGIVQESAVAAGASVSVLMTVGRLVVMTFSVAPVAADQGYAVYLDTAAGQVTMVAPSASGTTVFRVGVLQDASTQTVAFFPQYVALNP